MEAYLRSTKPSSSASSSSRDPSLKPSSSKPRPYASLTDALKSTKQRSALEGGVREANKPILKTLGREDNPITHSDAYSRALHVQSCASGHQSGGGPSRKWALHRNAKLRIQAAEKQSDTLKGVVAYISGYTGNEITNQGLKACVERQGGRVVTVASARCTHVFITSNLSGSKAQKYLEARKKCGYRLVLPGWATECERRGKRVCEAAFAAPVKNEVSRRLPIRLVVEQKSDGVGMNCEQLQESAYTIFGKSTTTLTLTSCALPSTSTSCASSLLIDHSPPRAREHPTDPHDAPSSSSSKSKRARLTVAEGGDDETVLSPSPSPRSEQNNRREKDKRHSRVPKDRGKDMAKEVVEDVLVLGSSDIEVETDVGPEADVHVEEEVRQGCGGEEVELDEWGMPPSGQRRR
ncbi:hypothetical protein JCM5296_006842 [Sporobolomyces johnsonii]